MNDELEKISFLYDLTKFIKIIFSPISNLEEYKKSFSIIYERLLNSKLFEKYKINAQILNELLNNSEKDQLLIEYSRLFIGPYHVLAVPYGSHYLENGKLMGESTNEVEQLYARAGLLMNDEFKDLPDHILAELEFIEYLLYKQYEAIINQNGQLIDYQSIFKNFVLIYFTSWMNDFVKTILGATDNHFYLIASNILFEYSNDIKKFSKLQQN